MAIEKSAREKVARAKTHAVKQDLHTIIEHDRHNRRKKSADEEAEAQRQANAQKRAARYDKARKEAHEKWYGKEGSHDGDNTVAGRSTRLSKEAGGRGYENYTSAMSQVVELSILICAAVAADLRTGDRLLDSGEQLLGLAGKVGGPAVSLAKEALKAPFNPKATLNKVSDMLTDFHKQWNEGVTLPESILGASHCEDGRLKFDSLVNKMPLGTPPALVGRMEQLNRFLVEEFLVNHNYVPDDQGVFKDSAGRALTQMQFENLKQDPKTGLEAFARKKHVIDLKDNVALTTGKHQSAAEISELEPEQRSRFGLR